MNEFERELYELFKDTRARWRRCKRWARTWGLYLFIVLIFLLALMKIGGAW